MKLYTENIFKALTVTWQSLLAIFIVVAIIIGFVVLLNFIMSRVDRHKASVAAAKSQEDSNPPPTQPQ